MSQNPSGSLEHIADSGSKAPEQQVSYDDLLKACAIAFAMGYKESGKDDRYPSDLSNQIKNNFGAEKADMMINMLSEYVKNNLPNKEEPVDVYCDPVKAPKEIDLSTARIQDLNIGAEPGEF